MQLLSTVPESKSALGNSNGVLISAFFPRAPNHPPGTGLDKKLSRTYRGNDKKAPYFHAVWLLLAVDDKWSGDVRQLPGDEEQDLKHFIGDTSFKVLLPLPSTLQRSCVWKALGKRLPAILPAGPLQKTL